MTPGDARSPKVERKNCSHRAMRRFFIDARTGFRAHSVSTLGGQRMAAKKKAKKKAAKKPAKKAKKAKPAKAKSKRKPNAAFMKAVTPSEELAAVVGANPMPRTEITKRLWAYIRKNGLQDSKNRRNINAD